MSNFSSILKSEVTRLARKEIKSAIDPLRKANAAYRRDIAELKRQLASLRGEIKAAARPTRTTAATAAAPKAKTRFVAKGLKSARARTGLSAADYGRLMGTSAQSIYNWETGKAVPQARQQAALATLRGLGKREAAKRLEALG